jgi:hypothetical protein
LNAMTDDQINEETIFTDEVSDETLEAAAFVALGGFPTLPHTYCFGCPARQAFGNRKQALMFTSSSAPPSVSFLDQDQIAKDWRSYKIGAGSPP